MTSVILMRASLAEEDELKVAKKYFNVYEQRSAIPENSLVIGRYSVLPFHKELENDLAYSKSKLINSTREHNYIADLKEWYTDLIDLMVTQQVTPQTWFSLEHFKSYFHLREGSFVLKGQTNSKKQYWNTHMFARTKDIVSDVYARLEQDGYLSDQEIYIRQYIPLKTFDIGIRGMPVTEEYRFFVLDGKIVGSGYYWSQFPEIKEKYNLNPNLVPSWFLDKVIDKVSSKARFFVLDVARTETDKWLVIEINDGCMSGLSDVNPDELYSNMSEMLKK